MKRKRWTKHDDAKLAELWATYTAPHIADIFHVSVSAIRHRGHKLKLINKSGLHCLTFLLGETDGHLPKFSRI